jgi:branched-chain amino acid transport system substrate-binding protein
MVYDKTCAYCTSPLVAGKAFFSSSSVPGMTLVPDVDDVPQTSDTTMIPTIAAQIRAIVGAEITKVNASPGSYYPLRWLWCGNSVTSCAGVAKGAGQGNADIKAMVPAANQWTVQVIANNWGIGETSSSLCGTGDGNKGDCDEVLFGLFPVPRYGDTSAGGMQAMIALHDKWGAADNTDGGTNTYADVRFVQGYAAALMWQRAVEAALDAGHATPTGDDIKAALEAFTNVSLQGMTAGPISFTGKDHRPQGTEAVYYLHQGTLTFDTTYSLTLDPTWIGY